MRRRPAELQAASAVVAAWIVDGGSLRDGVARCPQLRGSPAATRAAVARLAARAVQQRRRSEFALGGPRQLPRGPASQAAALVAAALVDAGDLGPGEASTWLVSQTGASLRFESPEAVDARIAAIEDPVERLGIRWSAPDWLVAALLRERGEHAGPLLAALGGVPPRTVRANLLRVAGREQLADRLAAEGIASGPACFAATALHIAGTADLFRTAAFGSGLFEQQDEASQLAVEVVAPPPGGRVLDLCAGTGGKTLALAAALGNRGAVLACDVHRGRLAALRERLPRAGADNVQVLAVPPHSTGSVPQLDSFATRADRILIDAPCTGTGSWRRRPEARWAVSAADEGELCALQAELLRRAAAWLRPGARLVYATCSLLAAENAQQIERLTADFPQLEVVRIAEVLGAARATPIADASGTFLQVDPARHGCDGFFAAVLRRRRTG